MKISMFGFLMVLLVGCVDPKTEASRKECMEKTCAPYAVEMWAMSHKTGKTICLCDKTKEHRGNSVYIER